MYKLSDKYWLKLAYVASVIAVVIFILICIGHLEQYFLNNDIEKYLIENGIEPPHEVKDEFRKASKIKTLPVSAALYFAVNYFSIKYWFKPKSK